jgi:sugar lactone lactonase YvrE
MQVRLPKKRHLAALIGAVALLAACGPGTTSIVAGNGAFSEGSGDGGPATAAGFRSPTAIAVAPDGSYYIVDTEVCQIRKVDTSGTISTVAGSAGCGNSGDGGPASAAQILPHGVDYGTAAITVAADGTVYFGQQSTIRAISPAGIISTLVNTGNAPNGYANDVTGLAAGPDGTLFYATDSGVSHHLTGQVIQRRTADGTTTEVGEADDGPGQIAWAPTGPNGTIYVADGSYGFTAINLDGGPSTGVSLPATGSVRAITVDAAGNVYTSDGQNVFRSTGSGASITKIVGNATTPTCPTADFAGTATTLSGLASLAATPNDGLLMLTTSCQGQVYRLISPATAP